MEVLSLRQVRHDLRTPLNHIVGYAELALESACEADDLRAQEPLKRIVGLGHGLTKIIDHRLPKSLPDAKPEGLIGPLRESLRPSLEQIWMITGFECFHDPLYAGDMERVRTAVDRLLDADPGGIPQADPKADAKAGPVASGELILVADDDHVNRDVLARMLRARGYRVSLAVDGNEAWRMIQAESHDLALLDMIMPGMSGLEVLRRIKADRAIRKLPVIMISGLDDVAAVAQTIEAGAEDYLSKPFEPAVLRARIDGSLAKRKIQQQMVAQEKLASLGALAAGVAHEIRNPLNFVLNFCEIATELVDELAASSERDQLLAKEIRDCLEKIREHALRTDQIVQLMLQHARPADPVREAVDINTVVRESVQLAQNGERGGWQGPPVAFETRFEAAPSVVQGCAADLGRAFLNLVSNAIYAAARSENGKGVVTLLTRRCGSTVEVRVRDNGRGVPAALRDKLFQPFFTTKPAGQGTGLGLSISHDIVVGSHGGELCFETEEGRYAEFIVRLPGE